MPIANEILPLQLAEITFPDDHPLSGQDGLVLAFLIRYDDAVLLFDTGIGEGNQGLDDRYHVVRGPLADELARQGVALTDVSAVVNSHLHFDHCGNNRLFPGATIYAQAKEFEAASQPGYTVAEWVGPADAQFVQLNGDHQLWNGLKLISTPGHTVGHQSLLVETKFGLELIVGQAIYSKAEYDQIRDSDELPPGDSPVDPEAYAHSAHKLIGLKARRVHFSHDIDAWESAG